MNILCLGCSWTADNNNISWPSELAKICPNITVYNLAWPGTGLLYSIYMMEKILNSGILIDKVIFQITSDARLTLYKNFEFNLENILDKTSFNYFRLKENDYFWTVQPGLLNLKKLEPLNSNLPKWKYLESFAKIYYSALDQTTQFDVEFKVQCEYVKNKADFCFFHGRQSPIDSTFELKNIDSIQALIDNEDLWKSFWIDDGKHFGLEGCQWQAQKIKEVLNLK